MIEHHDVLLPRIYFSSINISTLQSSMDSFRITFDENKSLFRLNMKKDWIKEDKTTMTLVG